MRFAPLIFAVLLTSSVWSQNHHLSVDQDHINIHMDPSAEPTFRIPLKAIKFGYDQPVVLNKLGSHRIKIPKKLEGNALTITRHDSSAIELAEENKQFRILGVPSGNRFKLVINHIGETAGPRHWRIPVLTIPDERFYGGGVQFSNVCLNGKLFKNISEENGIGRGDKPISEVTEMGKVKGEEWSTYYPVPFFVTNRKRGFEVVGNQYAEVDFQPDTMWIDMFTTHPRIDFYRNKSVVDIIRDFNQVNGRGKPVPGWALGNILGVQGGWEEVDNKLDMVQGEGAHIDAIWIQDWTGKKKTKYGSRLDWKWKIHPELYPDVADYIDQYHYTTEGSRSEVNIPLLGYINPFFAETGVYTEEGKAKKYLVKGNKGRARRFQFGGMTGYMLDIFDPDAYSWMKNIIKENLIETGFKGWMADFGEWYPIGKEDFPIQKHNEYCRLWIQLNNEVIDESGKTLFCFHRAGNYRTAQHTYLSWTGDQMVEYGEHDGLESAMKAMQSSGLSGLPPLHSDIGGYTSVKHLLVANYIRDRELMRDWMRLEAFTPVFRSHEGLLPAHNAQVYHQENAAEYAKWSRVHAALNPYFRFQLEAFGKTGIPVYRHPVMFEKPESDTIYIHLELYVGKDILIGYYDRPDEEFKVKTGWYLLNDDLSPSTDDVFQGGEKGSRVKVFIRKNSDLEKVLERQRKWEKNHE